MFVFLLDVLRGGGGGRERGRGREGEGGGGWRVEEEMGNA